MSHQMNTNFEDNLGTFVNFDADDQTSMSSTSDVKPVPALLHQSSSHFGSSHQTFPDQTHQYDLWKQQTGLPMGGYATTLAVNQATGLQYRSGNGGFVVPNDILNVPLSNLGDDWDFSKPQSYDMDIESDSPADIPSMLFSDRQNNMSPTQQAPPRIYPGMHTQQQKMQQAQKQQELMRQQATKQIPGQRSLPSTTPKTPVTRDPHVEESISRLLNRMRQASTASAEENEEDSQGSGSSNMPRIKKDEEDMDEDERLLNSEEGKKLTSKERRQLRNKVSARAFRSRRKEYITQLESELGVKNQEATELRTQNRQLMEENTRLTDLTRMLLSSQSFSGFLQELSQSGAQGNSNFQSLQTSQSARQQQAQQPQPQPTRKDISSHEAARQVQTRSNQMQVGMTFIPETTFDISAFDGPSMWGNVVPSNDFQVFAVTELPEPPKIDFSNLSEKPNAIQAVSNVSTKQCTPSVPSHPVKSSEKTSEVIISVDTSADLYDEPTQTITLPRELSITLSKAAVASEIVSASTTWSSTTSTDSWSRLRSSMAVLDEMCENLSAMMPLS